MNRKKEKKLSYIVLVIFAVLFILPLCWVILASLDSNANIAAKIPNLTMNNYKDILTSSTTWYSLKNGLILSLGTACAQKSPAQYKLATWYLQDTAFSKR